MCRLVAAHAVICQEAESYFQVLCNPDTEVLCCLNSWQETVQVLSFLGVPLNRCGEQHLTDICDDRQVVEEYMGRPDRHPAAVDLQ